MLCNISQNAMGQTPGGGYPARSSLGGGTLPGPNGGGTLPARYPAGGVPYWEGGTLPGPARGVGVPRQWVPCQGGTQVRYPPWPCQDGGVGTLLGGTQVRYPPPGQVRTGEGYPVRTTGVLHYTAGGMPLAFTQEDFLVK